MTRQALVARAARTLAACAFASGAIATSTGSCASSPDPGRATTIVAPDFVQFKTGGVNDLLANRCGTLDCHGQVGRPLRIYSRTGLRILDDAANVPGGIVDPKVDVQVAPACPPTVLALGREVPRAGADHAGMPADPGWPALQEA